MISTSLLLIIVEAQRGYDYVDNVYDKGGAWAMVIIHNMI